MYLFTAELHVETKVSNLDNAAVRIYRTDSSSQAESQRLLAGSRKGPSAASPCEDAEEELSDEENEAV